MRIIKMNNVQLQAARGSREYQAVLIDLISAGLIDKAKGEALLGCSIPEHLSASRYSEEVKEEKKVASTSHSKSAKVVKEEEEK